MLDYILEHLWQSTLIVLLAWAATRALRRHAAHWRYLIWFAASMKFLVPFALIAQLGTQIPWPAATTDAAPNAWQALAVRVLQPISSLDRATPANGTGSADGAVSPPPGSLAGQLLGPAASGAAPGPAAAATGTGAAAGVAGVAGAAGAASAANADGGDDALRGRAGASGPTRPSFVTIALAFWLLGSAMLLARWGRGWLALRGILARATPISVEPAEPGLPELRACSSIMEPGIFGIFKPVLLIPAALVERLSRDQLRAIIRHERVHADRRDNLTASLHMLVEALFWFHPFVWWIGARLVDERERACDEAVLASGVDPDVYASGLIEVCDFYVESPLMCAAGVGGGSLEGRVKRIADNERLPVLGRLGRAALIASPVAVCLVPLTLGLFEVQTARAQQAADETYAGLLECVNPDVLASLVFRGGIRTIVTDEVPAEMAGITPPDEFQWLGSQTRDMSGAGVAGLRKQVTAGFKTGLARDAAAELAMDALVAGGWERAEVQQRFVGGGAFASAMPAQPDVACRDDASVSVNVNELDGATYVSYAFTDGQVNSACQGGGLIGGMPGNQYAPSLELPIDPVTGQPARRGGSGSSGTQSRVEIRYNGSIGDVTEAMTTQLVEQGWVNDTSWTGTTTSGSSWWKQADPDTRVQGTLDVTATAESSYTIMFRLVMLQ